MPRQLLGTAIAANTITTTQLQTTIVNNITQGGGPRVTSLIYPGNDTAANTVGGQTVYVNGSGFASNAAVYINGSAVPSLAFISASNLQITTPALSSATYPVYVINPETGATAILIPGLVVSGEPTWVTAAGSLNTSQDELSAWSYNLSATGDAPITYSLAAGNTLPSGISLASNGAISGTLSSPAGNTTTYTFSVVATDAQNQDSTRQFTVTTTTGEGVLFANNVLLIHADGTNNGNNHAFIDSSNNNFTITRNGNATQGSFSPFSQTGWSAYFDGTGDYLSFPASSQMAMGTGDYTIEFWLYRIGTGDFCIIDNQGSGGNMQISVISGSFYHASATTWDYTFIPNVWTHIAFARQGTNLRLFVNGTLQQTQTNTNSVGSAVNTNTIGVRNDGNYPLLGYISNLRVVKGTAVYTSNFTPSTSPLTAVSNTSLLTLQSNRFIDNSTNAFTLTRNGDVSVQAFSPFAPTAAYSTANVGGSAYLDGSGDTLVIPYSASLAAGTSPYCFELWVYFTTSTGTQGIIGTSSDGFAGFERNSGSWGYYVGVSGINTNVPAIGGQWNHVVLCRDSSNNFGFFVNGTRIANGTDSQNKQNFGNPTIGYNGVGGGSYTTGYISDYRYVKGSTPYNPQSSTITVPTAPLTAIPNTAILINCINANIFDQTAKNVLETVGDAKVSTAQYKYGTGSIYLDGTDDAIVIRYNPVIDILSGGNFTVECWVRFLSTSGYSVIVGQWNQSVNQDGWLLSRSSNNITFEWGPYSTAVSLITSSTTVTTNQWYHIAVTKSGSNFKLYIDGTERGSASNSSTQIRSVNYTIGSYYTASNVLGAATYLNAYIDDLRITKGYARYTSNFTPPTSALKDK